VTEYELQQSLKNTKETIVNQIKKQTNTPSLRWVYFLFRGVNELNIQMGDHSKRLVVNVTKELKNILCYFGSRAKAIYLGSV
jgi:transposase